jgi:hypothetical protein
MEENGKSMEFRQSKEFVKTESEIHHSAGAQWANMGGGRRPNSFIFEKLREFRHRIYLDCGRTFEIVLMFYAVTFCIMRAVWDYSPKVPMWEASHEHRK